MKEGNVTVNGAAWRSSFVVLIQYLYCGGVFKLIHVKNAIELCTDIQK